MAGPLKLCRLVHWRGHRLEDDLAPEPDRPCCVGIVSGVIDGKPVLHVLTESSGGSAIAFLVKPKAEAGSGSNVWHWPEACPDGR